MVLANPPKRHGQMARAAQVSDKPPALMDMKSYAESQDPVEAAEILIVHERALMATFAPGEWRLDPGSDRFWKAVMTKFTSKEHASLHRQKCAIACCPAHASRTRHIILERDSEVYLVPICREHQATEPTVWQEERITSGKQSSWIPFELRLGALAVYETRANVAFQAKYATWYDTNKLLACIASCIPASLI